MRLKSSVPHESSLLEINGISFRSKQCGANQYRLNIELKQKDEI